MGSGGRGPIARDQCVLWESPSGAGRIDVAGRYAGSRRWGNVRTGGVEGIVVGFDVAEDEHEHRVRGLLLRRPGWFVARHR